MIVCEFVVFAWRDRRPQPRETQRQTSSAQPFFRFRRQRKARRRGGVSVSRKKRAPFKPLQKPSLAFGDRPTSPERMPAVSAVFRSPDSISVSVLRRALDSILGRTAVGRHHEITRSRYHARRAASCRHATRTVSSESNAVITFPTTYTPSPTRINAIHTGSIVSLGPVPNALFSFAGS